MYFENFWKIHRDVPMMHFFLDKPHVALLRKLLYRGVFRTQSNICGGAFFGK